MVKLLIIADDFTGALDTGVQFAASGAETRVSTNIEYDFKCVEESVQVFVLDAETRHLTPEDAYLIVFAITKRAFETGIPYIYKKTDSALRGNVGSELKAVLDATNTPILHFLPAFPKMNRITQNGTHYIDGVPVHESVFGQDPFEPVSCSYVPNIIQKYAPVTVVKATDQWQRTPGIMVYDSSTDEELMEVGDFLQKKGELHAMAGCAGFAAMLPQLLGLEGRPQKENLTGKHFLVACGSVNPITRSQLNYAEAKGFKRIRLNPEQKLENCYYQTESGKKLLLTLKETCTKEQLCIIDTNDLSGCRDTLEYAQAHQITLEELRVKISSTLGYIVKKLVDMGVNSTLMITGGDCLVGFMDHIGCHEITPICEMAPGTVLSEIKTKDGIRNVISKSGGFGSTTLLVDLAKTIVGA